MTLYRYFKFYRHPVLNDFRPSSAKCQQNSVSNSRVMKGILINCQGPWHTQLGAVSIETTDNSILLIRDTEWFCLHCECIGSKTEPRSTQNDKQRTLTIASWICKPSFKYDRSHPITLPGKRKPWPTMTNADDRSKITNTTA